jgi:uncharacterized protein YjbI with pentapeptide repeats
MTMKGRRLACLVFAALLGAGVVLSVMASVRSSNWWDLALNLGAELVGAVVVYVLLSQVIERTAGYTERREAEREAEARRIKGEKTRLVQEMASDDQDVAAAAVKELRTREWLYDGTLCDAYLACANLGDADLAKARLERADLHRAELAGACLNVATLAQADLSFANLERAEMGTANLTRSDLSHAELAGASLQNANLAKSDLSFTNLIATNLEDANLTRSNLSHADLTGVNLRGARLQGADLKFAHLVEAQLDETTELPDGTQWTEFSDLSRFTYPKHAKYWRSDDPASPAYRGNGGG